MDAQRDTAPADGQTRPALSPPVEIAVPSTPTPELSTAPNSQPLPQSQSERIGSEKPTIASPTPRQSSSDMTPPPSVQVPANLSTPAQRSRSQSHPFLASPPSTVNQSLYDAYGISERLPTVSEIDGADEPALRKIANELLVVAQDFRMSAAHFKLQNSLLSLTSNEAVKRAEVEQQLAKREVEILQSDEYRTRRGIAQEELARNFQNHELSGARVRIRDLEQMNATLDRRLHRAKQIIEEKSDQYELLLEENGRLKKRIRDNREHFTMMMDNGSLPSSPRAEFHTPQRKAAAAQRHAPESARSYDGKLGSRDLLATLLAADQVLHGDSTRAQPSQSKPRGHRNYHGHTRGAHSLSSLAPISQSRMSEPSQPRFFTPVNKRPRESRVSPSPASRRLDEEDEDRHDRDSTLSASDVEAVTDEDVPASQASSLATSMLRRYPGPSQEEPSIPTNIGKSSAMLQSKLFGHVKKAGLERPTDHMKRKSSSSDNKALSPKKARGPNPLHQDVAV
ncbi:uncharacterized protein GIQ15_06105 [Arthroderma uncinatum]|uniref:uncharacterized protein n=1 Tax=Arthroderma uncinatum TaxID=74035 RepID=UPI00144AE094|nr:uncharacterized protein GIQ15_06105 [Arthroderma uncinatum]KAF3480758.1 hypothetical protein GIQ15_06105 [Arthroderma uncinatum]